MMERRLKMITVAVLALLCTNNVHSETLKTSSSTSVRRLEDYNAYFAYDLTQYSLRFEKCQYVKMFDDELAQESDSPLALKHFVVFRLCPSDACESTCKENYGRYVVDVETYLESTVENQMRQIEYMCNNCDEECNENGEYCSGCSEQCYEYENLEEAGYVDASEYMECQQLDAQNGDDGNQYYIGPRCNSSGNKIEIGLFSDENCWEPVDDMDVEDLVGAELSYHLLAHTDSSGGSVCLSCKETQENANENDNNDEDEVNEMCEDVYDNSAKCESETGIPYGFVQTKRENDEYENQVETEFMACTFIDSLIWNSYIETGEINIEEEQDVIVREITRNQALSLSLLVVTMLGLVGLMYWFQRKIDAVSPRVQLSSYVDSTLT